MFFKVLEVAYYGKLNIIIYFFTFSHKTVKIARLWLGKVDKTIKKIKTGDQSSAPYSGAFRRNKETSNNPVCHQSTSSLNYLCCEEAINIQRQSYCSTFSL